MRKLNFILCFAGMILLNIFLLNQAAAADETYNISISTGRTYSTTLTILDPSCTNGFDIGASSANGNAVLTAPVVSGATAQETGTTLPVTILGKTAGTDVFKIFTFPNSPCITPSATYTFNVSVTDATTPAVTVATIFNGGVKTDPVSTVTGELFGHDGTADLTVNGPLPLTFRRFYASFLSVNKVSSPLGTNWMSNYDVSLVVSAPDATVTLFRGKTVTFRQASGAWQLSSVEQRPFQLIAAGSGYQFLDPRSNLIYGFSAAGALTSIHDRNGNTLTVSQGANGPTQVADGLGRTLAFTYTGANLTKVQDQAGRTVSYEYTNGALSASTDANGNRSTISYTSSGEINGLMTTLTRPAGNRPLSQAFDSQGRVSTQTPAVGASMTFTYNSGSNGATAAEPGGADPDRRQRREQQSDLDDRRRRRCQ